MSSSAFIDTVSSLGLTATTQPSGPVASDRFGLFFCLVVCFCFLIAMSIIALQFYVALLAERKAMREQDSMLERERRMRRHAEEAEIQYVKLVERSCDFDAIMDLDGQCLYLNDYGKELIGICDEDYRLTISIFDMVDEHSVRKLRDDVIPSLTDTGWMGEIRLRNIITGELFLCDSTWMAVLNPDDDVPICIACTARDITQSITDEMERRRLEAERQRLLERLVEVQEAERRRIARDLHDEIGQILTGLKLTLEMSRRLADGGELEQSLDQAGCLVQDAIRHVRELALELRPAMLDDLGLLAALRWHFDRYTSASKIPVIFEHDPIGSETTPDIDIAIYRIVQEALTNVVRHAHATQVTVRLCLNDDDLTVHIQDNGLSFDPDRAIRTGTSTGLAGMRERTMLLGGRFTISSAPERGTTIRATFPLHDHNDLLVN